jgi:hypothetical protein
MGSRLHALKVIALAAVAAFVTAVPAEAQPRSHADALAAGDPAATAPSFRDDAHGAVYRGNPVSKATIQSQDLACLAVQDGPSRCYGSAQALEAAELTKPASASRKRRRKARAAACGIYEILHIWVSADYTGSVASLADRHRWANIGNGMNNRGSSFVMGDHSGHLAEHYDGLGWWYPGNTGVCAFENNLNKNGSGWNNRISSRYRN